AVAAAFREDLVVDEDRDAFVRRDLARAVLGARVDDDDLVHERDALDEARADRVDDPPDRRLLVQRGQADRDTETLALLLLDGMARGRDGALHALVVGTLAEELVEGRTAARAVAAGDVEEGHRAVARPRELRADPRRELGIAAAPDRDEDAPGPRRRAFDDGEIAGGISQHLLDRETEDVPARP